VFGVPARSPGGGWGVWGVETGWFLGWLAL